MADTIHTMTRHVLVLHPDILLNGSTTILLKLFLIVAFIPCSMFVAPLIGADGIEIEGTLKQDIYRRRDQDVPIITFNYDFKVLVRGSEWSVQTVEKDKAGNVLLKRQVGSTNGEQIFEAIEGAPNFSTLTGSIVSSCMPVGINDQEVYAHLWVAFASGHYFATVATNYLPPFYDYYGSVVANPDLRIKAEWDLLNGVGSLPANLSYIQTKFGVPWAVYKVLEKTNYAGAVLPTEINFTQYDQVYPSLGPTALIKRRMKISVNEIRSFPSSANLAPNLKGKAVIVDHRVQGKPLTYASDHWVSVEEAVKLSRPTANFR